jgi:small subunit ribosomal protein S4
MEKRPVAPGQHGLGRKKVTDYGEQLREKQKVKRAYGLLEKQFREYYEKATRMKGVVGENMLSLLERRLDNVIYRMGIGDSRAQSRQIVNHGHICVNGRVVNIPSYSVKVGDEVSIKESKQELEKFKQLRGIKITMPKWLDFNTSSMSGKILALPQRDDIDLNIREHMIIELYSR